MCVPVTEHTDPQLSSCECNGRSAPKVKAHVWEENKEGGLSLVYADEVSRAPGLLSELLSGARGIGGHSSSQVFN